ncbi:nicotinate (nicotinamide) nucleotide adenylyltransferase [Candidatus Gottesmanbacteria bacterium]|nr:nicotinate (nicotinamide) nucleotide adenylyltransferase [Candidatus Gottesmanbacteria bacterium]
MNIAILGGKFDPPHIWHFLTAQQVLENVPEIDQAWLLPDYTNAFRPIVAMPSDRIEMLHFLETGRIKLSTIAIAREETTYTVNIATELKKDLNNRYYWIVGSDVTTEFSRWRDYQKLSRLMQFLVFPRKDYPIKNLPQGFQKVPGDLLLSNISSTTIRDRVKNGLSITGLVFPEVEDYIRRRNLYK